MGSLQNSEPTLAIYSPNWQFLIFVNEQIFWPFGHTEHMNDHSIPR